ncbi:MAG TPA: hypothetical protein VMG12_26825 [Polyangiaceae bacterium]|nr:hypothetical protein [Polyangiaceae bacterium]
MTQPIDNDDALELHALETIEQRLSEDAAVEADADGFSVASASGFLVPSASGFLVNSASGFAIG